MSPASTIAAAPARAGHRSSLVARSGIIIVLLACAGLAALLFLGWSAARDEDSLAGIMRRTDGELRRITAERVDAVSAISSRQASMLGATRGAQLAFQIQISQWKSLLQRGGRPDQKAHFLTAFNDQEKAVRAACAELNGLLAGDAQTLAALERFTSSYERLMKSYRNGLGMIDLADSFAEGAKSADDYMIDRDREPIATLDGLVERARSQAEEQLHATAQAGRDAVASAVQSGSTDLEQAITRTQARNRSFAIAFAALLACLAAGAIQLVRMGLRPLGATVRALDALADGDLTMPPSAAQGGDEIGRMTAALGRAVAGTRASVERISQDAEGLTRSMSSLSGTGERLKELVGRVLTETRSSTQAGEQIAGNAHTVSTAMEEMTGSVREISRACGDAAVTGTTAVREATAAEALVAELIAQSTQIAEFTKLIANIAAQTKLLALNATIEAARAGESGKGFSVVADEVKQLARRTTEATDDIEQKVGAVGAGARNVEQAITAIIGHIRRLDDMQRSIVAAVAQQSSTTTDVARRIGEVATACGEITAHLSASNATALAAHEQADLVSAESQQLAAVISRQRAMLARFRI